MEQNEQTILNNIHETTNKLLMLLNEIRESKQKIANDIENLDNNYFIEKTDISDKFNGKIIYGSSVNIVFLLIQSSIKK